MSELMEKCWTCKGKGTLILKDDREFICPNCKDGFVLSSKGHILAALIRRTLEPTS